MLVPTLQAVLHQHSALGRMSALLALLGLAGEELQVAVPCLGPVLLTPAKLRMPAILLLSLALLLWLRLQASAPASGRLPYHAWQGL